MLQEWSERRGGGEERGSVIDDDDDDEGEASDDKPVVAVVVGFVVVVGTVGDCDFGELPPCRCVHVVVLLGVVVVIHAAVIVAAPVQVRTPDPDAIIIAIIIGNCSSRRGERLETRLFVESIILRELPPKPSFLGFFGTFG